MDILYKINEENFLKFHSDYIMSSDGFRMFTRPFIISLLILLVICVLFSPMRVGLILGAILFFLFIKTGLFHKIILNRYKQTLKISLRKNVFKSDVYRNTFQLINLFIIDTGIKTETCYGRNFFAWESLYDLHLIENYIIIRTICDEIVYIPCKDIDVDKFIQIISNHTDLTINKRYPTDIKYKKYFV